MYSATDPQKSINEKTSITSMTTSIILLLSVTVALLTIVIVLLIRRNMRQVDELQDKNRVIVREVRRNQELLQRATRQTL
jgi:hypothetical protein